jgi:hypothetical protein
MDADGKNEKPVAMEGTFNFIGGGFALMLGILSRM